LNAYRLLATETEGSITDTLTRAHLHLALNEYTSAFTFFTSALNRLEHSPLMTLENLMDAADDHLRKSRYVRAAELLQSARTSVDTLLSAQAGLAVATARMTGSTACAPGSIVPLAKLGDLLLRMLARTHLASNLAVSLRRRSLRHDLAPWATGAGSIELLLDAEFRQLQAGAKNHPCHAELHYRLGLVARTLGQPEVAVQAFTRVLSLHAHHVPSAARLAATCMQLGQDEPVLPVLAVAFAVPGNMLQQYAALADAAQSRSFDKAAERLAGRAEGPANLLRPGTYAGSAVAVKANLAFALSELGLLDPVRAEWREAVAV
jgi:tetratricopeptide (TPR) repeat protein